MTPISMNPIAHLPGPYLEEELALLRQVLTSGRWILGPQVTAFEKAWSQYLGTEHTVGCASGLDALELGLRALELPPGSEVITTPLTAFATVLAIVRAGLTPVLADIDSQTGLLDPPSVQRCITGQTRAILLVHLYGQAGPVEALGKIAQKHSIHLLEDCAQAHGARLHGSSVGNWGTWAAWSFYPSKNLGASGDAGALTCSDPLIAQKVRQLAQYGQQAPYHHTHLGLNSRLDEIQAALLVSRLSRLEAWNTRRKAIASFYHREIRHPQITLLAPSNHPESHVYHQFVVCTEFRKQLRQFLADRAIETLVHYPVPAHQQPALNAPRCDPSGLPQTEKFTQTCLSLPCHPGLTDLEVERVASTLNQF
jgi:dTDP-4-amino-4,6-dideoxygalactose transaminase